MSWDVLLYRMIVVAVYLCHVSHAMSSMLIPCLAYDTTPFCHSYKDERGQPVNVRVQQDAQEFFNVLCDRLEKKLKGTSQEHLFKQMFGGHLANQVRDGVEIMSTVHVPRCTR